MITQPEPLGHCPLFTQYPCAKASLWSPSHFAHVEAARSFGDLVPVALRILECFEEDVTIVSGPISTGGFGTRDANIKAFTNAIRHLQSQRRSVIDQTPFETALARLAKEWIAAGGEGYVMPILTDFYGPVFRSGHIKTIAFMRGWESSFGAQWEHREAHALGLTIEYLPMIEP